MLNLIAKTLMKDIFSYEVQIAHHLAKNKFSCKVGFS